MESARETQHRPAKAQANQKREEVASKPSIRSSRVKTEPNTPVLPATISNHKLYRFQPHALPFFIAVPVWPPFAIGISNNAHNRAKDTSEGSMTTLATSKLTSRGTDGAEAKDSKKRKRPESDSEGYDAGFASDEVSSNTIIRFTNSPSAGQTNAGCSPSAEKASNRPGRCTSKGEDSRQQPAR